MKTASQVENRLKKKLNDMNPAKKNKKQTNKQTKASQTSIQDIQEMSATNDSQPVNKSSLLKQPNPENEIGETMVISKKKKFKPD